MVDVTFVVPFAFGADRWEPGDADVGICRAICIWKVQLLGVGGVMYTWREPRGALGVQLLGVRWGSNCRRYVVSFALGAGRWELWASNCRECAVSLAVGIANSRSGKGQKQMGV